VIGARSIPGVLLLLAFANPAPAEDSGWRLDLGAAGGAMLLDEDLQDNRWDVGPVPAFTLAAQALRGRYALVLAYGKSLTVQGTGIPGESIDPRVDLHSIDALASARILQWAGLELWGQLHGGRILMRYQPDSLVLAAPGGGAPIEVQFDPIHEWTAGVRTSIRREFQGRFALTATAGYSTFGLDTAHRRGSEIVEQRERFHNWSLGFGASWLLDL